MDDEKEFKQLAVELDGDTLRNLLLQINHALPDAASVSLEFLAKRNQLGGPQGPLKRSFSLNSLVNTDGMLLGGEQITRLPTIESLAQSMSTLSTENQPTGRKASKAIKQAEKEKKAEMKEKQAEKKKLLKAKEKEDKKLLKAGKKLAKKHPISKNQTL